jgi:hypothetical protein
VLRIRKAIKAVSAGAIMALPLVGISSSTATAGTAPPGDVVVNPPPYYSTITGLLNWGGFESGYGQLGVSLNNSNGATLAANEGYIGRSGPWSASRVMLPVAPRRPQTPRCSASTPPDSLRRPFRSFASLGPLRGHGPR